MIIKGVDGKEQIEYVNRYFIMYKEQVIDKKFMEYEKQVQINNYEIRCYNSVIWE